MKALSPFTHCGRCGHQYQRHPNGGRCLCRPRTGSPMRCEDGSCGCLKFLDDRRPHDPRSVSGLARSAK